MPGCLPNQRPRCKQRGIKLAALQSSGVFDPRGSRQISMQAWLLGSLLAGIKQVLPADCLPRQNLFYERAYALFILFTKIYSCVLQVKPVLHPPCDIRKIRQRPLRLPAAPVPHSNRNYSPQSYHKCRNASAYSWYCPALRIKRFSSPVSVARPAPA